MGQEFKQQYYKTLNLGKDIKVYLFKNLESWDGKPYKLSWMTAYKERNGDDFIVESGAGITEKRMESQIMSYLKRKIKLKGYV